MRQAWLLFPFLQMIKLRLMLSKLVSFTKYSFHNNSYLGKHVSEHFLSTFWHNTCCGLLPPCPRTLFSLLFSCSVVSDSLWPHGLRHIRFSCPSPSPVLHHFFLGISQSGIASSKVVSNFRVFQTVLYTPDGSLYTLNQSTLLLGGFSKGSGSCQVYWFLDSNFRASL